MRSSRRPFLAFIGTLAIAVLAACGQSHPDPVVVTQPAPQAVNVAPGVAPQVVQAQPSTVVVQQPHDSGIGDLATGMMLGHMMSGGGGGGYGGGGTTVNKTVVNKTVVNKTYAAPAPAAPRPTYSAPARSSYSAGSSFTRSSGRR